MPRIVDPRWRVANAHKDNCCAVHGCRWSEKDCPVVSGTARSGPCQKCLGVEDDRPTKAAYMAACRALWRHREGEEKLTAANRVLCEKNKNLRDQIRLLKKRAAAARRIQARV